MKVFFLYVCTLFLASQAMAKSLPGSEFAGIWQGQGVRQIGNVIADCSTKIEIEQFCNGDPCEATSEYMITQTNHCIRRSDKESDGPGPQIWELVTVKGNDLIDEHINSVVGHYSPGEIVADQRKVTPFLFSLKIQPDGKIHFESNTYDSINFSGILQRTNEY